MPREAGVCGKFVDRLSPLSGKIRQCSCCLVTWNFSTSNSMFIFSPVCLEPSAGTWSKKTAAIHTFYSAKKEKRKNKDIISEEEPSFNWDEFSLVGMGV